MNTPSQPSVKVEKVEVSKQLPKKEQLKEVMRVVSEGIGAIRKGQYEGHQCVAITEVLIFLKNFYNDLSNEYEKLVKMPMATFGNPKVPTWPNGREKTEEEIKEDFLKEEQDKLSVAGIPAPGVIGVAA